MLHTVENKKGAEERISSYGNIRRSKTCMAPLPYTKKFSIQSKAGWWALKWGCRNIISSVIWPLWLSGAFSHSSLLTPMASFNSLCMSHSLPLLGVHRGWSFVWYANPPSLPGWLPSTLPSDLIFSRSFLTSPQHQITFTNTMSSTSWTLQQWVINHVFIEMIA